MAQSGAGRMVGHRGDDSRGMPNNGRDAANLGWTGPTDFGMGSPGGRAAGTSGDGPPVMPTPGRRIVVQIRGGIGMGRRGDNSRDGPILGRGTANVGGGDRETSFCLSTSDETTKTVRRRFQRKKNGSIRAIPSLHPECPFPQFSPRTTVTHTKPINVGTKKKVRKKCEHHILNYSNHTHLAEEKQQFHER